MGRSFNPQRPPDRAERKSDRRKIGATSGGPRRPSEFCSKLPAARRRGRPWGDPFIRLSVADCGRPRGRPFASPSERTNVGKPTKSPRARMLRFERFHRARRAGRRLARYRCALLVTDRQANLGRSSRGSHRRRHADQRLRHIGERAHRPAAIFERERWAPGPQSRQAGRVRVRSRPIQQVNVRRGFRDDAEVLVQLSAARITLSRLPVGSPLRLELAVAMLEEMRQQWRGKVLQRYLGADDASLRRRHAIRRNSSRRFFGPRRRP
jgi:hypothetical protein